MWELTFPRTIVTGEDALEYLKTIEGKYALIVTDEIIHKLNFARKAKIYLEEAGLDVKVFDEVEPEPGIDTVHKGAEVARQCQPDWIIGLGGGSCMDAAKAIWVLYEKPGAKVEDINPLTELGLRKKAKLMCIPTTSGTGSEATWVTIITDAKNEIKLELPSRELVADVAILDPELPKSMPHRVVAETGLDALTHAIEAYTSQWRNDFSDALAIKAIQIVFRYLLRAYRNPEDKEAREKMHEAATMAGMAFSNSQVGIAHAMGHSLGAIFNVPHGRTVAVFLPYSIQYSVKDAIERFAEIAGAIQIEAETGEKAVEKLVEAVSILLRNLDEPHSIMELGINREDFDKRLEDLVSRVRNSACTLMSPRVPDDNETRKLFIFAFEGRPVDF